MLTGDLAISWQRGQQIEPYCVAVDEPDCQQTAAALARIVQQHVGRKRAELERALDEYMGASTDYKAIRGLIKLLLDRCVFETVAPVEPAKLRRAVFFQAAADHPIIDEAAREKVVAAVAETLLCPRATITEALYADLADQQSLTFFEELDATDLLQRYNLAQAQALLYRCQDLTIWIAGQEQSVYRRLFTEIKAFRLIHAIKGSAARGYEIQLSGPVSLFHRSQRYGVQMSVFLPALLLLPGWRLRAEIATKNRGRAYYDLDSRTTLLQSHYVAEQSGVQSSLLDKLLADWTKLGGEWTAAVCQEMVELGGVTCVPDAVLTHTSGRRVYLELLGFWTPRYLKDRLQELARGGGSDVYLLAVSEEFCCSREAPPNLPPNVISFKTSLAAKEVLARLHKLADAARQE